MDVKMYLLYCTVLYCTVLYCTVVMTPPKQPNLSMRMVSAPALLAASAADSPEGPPPTTSTSHLSVDKGFVLGALIHYAKGWCMSSFFIQMEYN